jgi:hypothetical protein
MYRNSPNNEHSRGVLAPANLGTFIALKINLLHQKWAGQTVYRIGCRWKKISREFRCLEFRILAPLPIHKKCLAISHLNLRQFERFAVLRLCARREELPLVGSTSAKENRLSCLSWDLLYALCTLSITRYTHYADCV